MTLKTQSLFGAMLIGFMAAPALAQDAKPNFTGKWTLDAAKSDFGQYPRDHHSRGQSPTRRVHDETVYTKQ